MAARNALSVVRPEQRNDQRIAVLAVVIEAGEEAEGPILPKGSKAPRGTVDAGRAVKLLGDALGPVPPQTYVMSRLARWGYAKRWLTRVGVSNPKPKLPQSWWGPCVLDGNVEQIGIESMRDVCPWNLDETRETDLCVNALPAHLSVTVIETYVKTGPRDRKAWRLGVDERTMRRRLDQAYPLLLELFNLAAADLPLVCSYDGPGRPRKDEDAAE